MSDELGACLAEEAARQSVTPQELATTTLAEYIATRRPHGTGTAHESTAPAAQAHRPKTATVHAPQDRSERNAARLVGEIPAAMWLGLFVLVAALIILIIVLIVNAL